MVLLSCKDNRPEIDDRTVFRYNEHANITTLDPAFARDQRNIWACNLLYNGLVQLDKNLNVIPDLASSWDISADGLVYTFKLKKEVMFHDNYAFAKARSITAQDFKFSLERLTNVQLASPGSWTMEEVREITAVDDHTLQITLRRPFPAFLGILTMKYCSVVRPEAVQHYGSEFRSHPTGTGPFCLKRWEENVKMVLRRHSSYHEKDATGTALPYLEAVAITFKNDKQSEFLEFAQGNLDFLNAIDPSYKDELLTNSGQLKPKYDSIVTMKKAPFLNTEYLGIDVSGGEQSLDLELRQAMNCGFDREKMMKYLRNSIGKPAVYGFIPLGIPGGGKVKGASYDPDRARTIINNYKSSGKSIPEITISTSANYLDLCEFIQKEYQNIGLPVNVEVMPPSTLRQARSVGNLQVFRSSWIADYPDAQNYLSLFYSKNFAPNGPNYTRFKNELYDELYKQSLATANESERALLYHRMDSILVQEAPAIPLYYDESVRFIHKNVLGLETNAVNMLDLTRVRKN